MVGAGLAGLTAAGALSRRGQSVLVLEARDRVGGRIETAVLSDGTAVDLGGQWIAEAHTRLRSLLEQHQLTLVPASRGEVTVRL
ncbi:FAD-dependent oxidoreductase, partial [Klebsiella pneumoniae]|nr:FAD-dependent oxidoreductase [Klebsiella pneumoniae]